MTGARERVVVDPCVLAVALADDGEDGDLARVRLRGCQLIAPAGIDLDVMVIWRQAVRSGALTERRSELARADLAELPIQRVGATRLAPLCWPLLDQLNGTDSGYVALARALSAPLLTNDRNLLSRNDLPCSMERIG